MNKKLQRLIIGVTCGIALIGGSSQAIAQRGEKTLGIGGGYATYNQSGYTDIYFQYSFARHFRISPEVGYVISHNRESALFVDVDMHFPFRIARGIHLYPLAGVTFNNWSHSAEKRTTRFGGNAGGGIDFTFTPNLKLTLQGKYSLMKDTDGAYIGLGLGYVF